MRFHEEQHGVYFDDLDPFRILHNARYLLIMERTIGSFWHHLGWRPIGDGNHDPDQDHLVRAQDISYEVPVQGTGRVRCRIWVEHLGRTSLQFGFQILPMDEDTPHCRGHRTLVRINADTREAVPWSDEFRVRIRPYRRDTDPPAA